MLYLVRHSQVGVQAERPGPEWHLSEEGRTASEALGQEPRWGTLARLYTSPEPKAVATAQRLAAPHGLLITIEAALREVENRPWVGEGYAEQVRRYLAGEAADPWEAKAGALDRVRACLAGISGRHPEGDVGVVSHGLVLTIYLADLAGLDGAAAYELWQRIRMPDVAVVDPVAATIERAFGES